jgi:hypothetical protein
VCEVGVVEQGDRPVQHLGGVVLVQHAERGTMGHVFVCGPVPLDVDKGAVEEEVVGDAGSFAASRWTPRSPWVPGPLMYARSSASCSDMRGTLGVYSPNIT